MDADAVPPALRERLGSEATTGLLDLLARSHEEERATMIAACTERFERRLVEEIADVRVQIARVEGSLRTEIAQMGASIRQEMAEMGGSIRQEMAEMGASIRQDMALMGASIRQDMAQIGPSIREEMAQMGGSIRQEVATGRVELFKWCFLFWVGQVMVVLTAIGVVARLLR
jgi:hypothetical protein